MIHIATILLMEVVTSLSTSFVLAGKLGNKTTQVADSICDWSKMERNGQWSVKRGESLGNTLLHGTSIIYAPAQK